MRTADSLAARNSFQKHKNELANIDKKHKNEIEKIKISQTKQINEIKNSNTLDLLTLSSENEQKVITATNRNESRLKNIKKSLDDVNATVDKEKTMILSTHKQKMDDKNTVFEADFSKVSQLNSLKVQDLNHEANSSLQNLQYKLKAKEVELNQNSRRDLATQDVSSKKKLQNQKDTEYQKEIRQTEKFSYLNEVQRKEHQSQSVNAERKHQRELENTNKNNQAILDNVDKTASKAKIGRKKAFEKEYAQLNKEQELVLSNLVGKKESLIHQLKDKLKNVAKLGMKKSEDPFYAFAKLAAKLTQHEKGYTIDFKVAPHEAKNITMRAEKRELRFNMERNHKFTSNSEGTINKMNKVESYSSKMPVKNIIDPDTIKRSYDNGVLTFSIGLA